MQFLKKDELKTQRTHSTSESSDYTLENYIPSIFPNKDNDGASYKLFFNFDNLILIIINF